MKKPPVTYAFIDSQNLNLGVRSQGWHVDYRRLRLYLKNRYNVQRAFMFIGYVGNNVELYASLVAAGFELIYKPTVAYRASGKLTHKGNVDAELVLWASAKVINEYDQAIIISADGDFRCLYEYLNEKSKLRLIISPSQRFSHLLSPFKEKVVRISRLRGVLEYKKQPTKRNQPKRSVETLGRAGHNIAHRRSVETLGLSRHGDDNSSIAKSSQKVNKGKRK
ncbi:NYN domain-containing protein [Candidatus Saccharibacteria bacterium]|nr:NYN domain-containing protein [Candidatus Saccharibacteria bacterium]